jgi:Ca2+/H+ antiporter
MFLDFLKILGTILTIVWVSLILLLYFLDKSMLFKEILIGCLLPVVCFIPGFYAVSWAVNRPFRPFLIAVFGGMLVRLLFIGTAFMLIATLTQLHMASLLFSLVGFYTLCLVVELYFINSKTYRR